MLKIDSREWLSRRLVEGYCNAKGKNSPVLDEAVEEMGIKTGPDSGHILKVEPMTERIKCNFPQLQCFVYYLFLYYCYLRIFPLLRQKLLVTK